MGITERMKILEQNTDRLQRENEALQKRIVELERAIAYLTVKYTWNLSKDHHLSEELKDYVSAYDSRSFLTMSKIRKNIIDILQGEKP